MALRIGDVQSTSSVPFLVIEIMGDCDAIVKELKGTRVVYEAIMCTRRYDMDQLGLSLIYYGDT